MNRKSGGFGFRIFFWQQFPLSAIIFLGRGGFCKPIRRASVGRPRIGTKTSRDPKKDNRSHRGCGSRLGELPDLIHIHRKWKSVRNRFRVLVNIPDFQRVQFTRQISVILDSQFLESDRIEFALFNFHPIGING